MTAGTDRAIELLTRARTLMLSYITALEERPGSYYGAGRLCVKDLEIAVHELGGPEYPRQHSGVILPAHDVLQ